MTVENATPCTYLDGESPGVGDAEYPFAFKCFDEADLLVAVDNGTGMTTLVLNTDYTVTLNADQDTNPGGSVFSDGAYSGYTVYIASNIEILQETDLRNATSFRAATVEEALDRVTLFCQQLRLDLNRCLRHEATEEDALALLPAVKADRASKYLAYDSNGDLTVVSALTKGTLSATAYMEGLVSSIASLAALRSEIGAIVAGTASIVAADIASNAITTAKILDGNVTLAKLAAGILADSADGRAKMADGFLSANASGRAKMADDYVTLDKMVAGTANKYLGYDNSGNPAEKAAPRRTTLYSSTPVAVTNNTSSSYAHGLGAVPTRCRVMLKCISTTGGHGYSVGDVIRIDTYKPDDVFVFADATNVIMKILTLMGSTGSAYIYLPSKSGTALAWYIGTSWNLYVEAEV